MHPCALLSLRFQFAIAALALAVSLPAQADEDKPEAIAYKLTPTYMDGSDGVRAYDLNLRGSKGPHYAWIGYYRDNQGVRQWRTGYEYRIDNDAWRLVLSPQWAGGGFLSLSANSELGPQAFFGILGLGRTNLRNSYSLTFDPNDAITLGAGTRAIDKLEFSLFQIRDNRLDTGQRVTHAVTRWSPADKQRLTLDLVHKRGLATNGQMVSGNSFTLTYDYGNYFVRVARDAYANFSPATQKRFSAGLRF